MQKCTAYRLFSVSCALLCYMGLESSDEDSACLITSVISHYVIKDFDLTNNKKQKQGSLVGALLCFIMHRARRCLLYSCLDILALYMRCAIGLKNCILRKSEQEP